MPISVISVLSTHQSCTCPDLEFMEGAGGTKTVMTYKCVCALSKTSNGPGALCDICSAGGASVSKEGRAQPGLALVKHISLDKTWRLTPSFCEHSIYYIYMPLPSPLRYPPGPLRAGKRLTRPVAAPLSRMCGAAAATAVWCLRVTTNSVRPLQPSGLVRPSPNPHQVSKVRSLWSIDKCR